jgi:hypothetical protein
MLQRQHFNAIAKACRAYRVREKLLEAPYDEFIQTLARVLAETNPAFDKPRFIAACDPQAWDSSEARHRRPKDREDFEHELDAGRVYVPMSARGKYWAARRNGKTIIHKDGMWYTPIKYGLRGYVRIAEPDLDALRVARSRDDAESVS